MIIRKVRKALWLIKYFGFNALLSVFTHELREPIIIKCNGDEVEATPYMLRWLLHAMDLGYVKKVHCGDGEFVIINKYDDEVRIKYNNDGYVINGYRFKSLNRPLAAVFLGEEYWGVNARNKIIIDIGAFVGDSAIYFVLKGARRIIAIEPHPGAFAEMLDNIKLNNLEGVIIPVNAGLVGKPGKICIEDVGVEDTAVTYHRPGDCPSTIKAVTLGELINGFGIDGDRTVLKMDCEGCEFDVILNDYEHVRLFRELIFEYHSHVVNKPVDDILRVLDRDYKCEVRGDKNGGIIQCIRK